MVPFERVERLAAVNLGGNRYEVQKRKIIANVARNSVVMLDSHGRNQDTNEGDYSIDLKTSSIDRASLPSFK